MRPIDADPPPDPDAGSRSLVRRDSVPAAASAEPTLFRGEVAAARQTQWLGTVLLAPRISHSVFTLLGVLAASAVVALLFFADFTRKARIDGWLVPQEGVMQVVAPRPGVVTRLHVEEGAQVRRGDPLLTLSEELQSTALGATQVQIGQRLSEQVASLREGRARQQKLLVQQQAALGDRLAALGTEQQQIDSEIGMLKSRLKIAQRAEALHRDMKRQGFISEPALQRAESERLEQGVRLGALERARTTLARDRGVVEGELRDLPLKIEREIGDIERSLSQLEQERAQTEALREIVVSAPQDGTVTAIGAVRGGHAQASAPLLSILPHDSLLVAHLYSPSRAIGFARPGQRVLLRYEAYPYQRFGHYEGVLASVSRVAVPPGELPAQLAAGAASQPVYRITVRLGSQTVTAYGEPIALQPGMALQADVMLERRRLYEWVLDPLYTLTGKWQG